MKRISVHFLAVTFILSACIPTLPSLQQSEKAPAVDVQATDEALAATLAVETLNALPTPTLEPATNTPEPTETELVTSTVTETTTSTIDPNATATDTLTPDPNATETNTGTPETATAITGTAFTPTVTETGTVPTATKSATPTATETLYARFYGTLPPSIPSGRVRLINKSKADVYISLQCTTLDGYKTILEYPVDKQLRAPAPAGNYFYRAYVGGKKFEGWFNLGKGDLVEITFEKKKVSIK